MWLLTDDEIEQITEYMNRINEIIHECDDAKPRTEISYENCKCSLGEGVDSPTETTENTNVTTLMHELVMNNIEYSNSRSEIIEKISNTVKSVGKDIFGESVKVVPILYSELGIRIISENKFMLLTELLDFISELRLNVYDIELDFETDIILLKVKYPEVNQVDDEE